MVTTQRQWSKKIRVRLGKKKKTLRAQERREERERKKLLMISADAIWVIICRVWKIEIPTLLSVKAFLIFAATPSC